MSNRAPDGQAKLEPPETEPRLSSPPQSDLLQDPPTGMPRWVKLFILVGFTLVLMLGVAQLLGGGHGPGRHFQPSTVSEPVSSPPDSSTP